MTKRSKKREQSLPGEGFGYQGGEPVVRLFNTFNGGYYVVAYDNDTQPYVYRADLFRDPAEQGASRPDADTPLYGDNSTHAPFWQVANWQQRFVSSAVPDMFYFNDDGSANVNNEAGIRACEEHIKSAEWGGPNVLRNIWIDQYASFGACNSVMGSTFPNVTKVTPGNPDLDTGACGRFLATELTPGRVVDGQLVRRPVMFFNLSWGVNGFADPARHEAAYLFLQWSGGARIFTWMTGNPAGFMDPHHSYSFTDALTIDSYSRGSVNDRREKSGEVLQRIIPFTAPLIQQQGAAEYTNALDVELQAALAGETSAVDAMASVERQWNEITERIGVDQQAASIRAVKDAWPTATLDRPSDVVTS